MGRIAKAPVGREEQADSANDKRQELLHELELKHQKNASDTDLLHKDEDVRRLRTRILMLRDENTCLRDQVQHNNDANAKLAAQCDNLGAQIEAKMEVVRSQEKQLRKQEREYANLKAELQAMTNVTQESTNILSEKLSLSRELATLKPEMEHLRSQVNQQQETLAEKLSLERQVNTLEVELANEKKAAKRAVQKRESNDRVEDELRKKLREAEKSLAAEKSERERLEDQLEQEKRSRQFALQEQDTTRESEADLRKKLQDAQRELRQEKEDRERIEEELQAAQRASKKPQKTSNTEEEDALRSELEEAQSSLSAQRKENAKLRQENQSSVSESESRAEQLEKRLEKMKTKLRETQDQLKQSQAELKKAQQQQSRAPHNEMTKANSKSQAFRKRKVHDLSNDEFTNIEIPTPGAEDMTKGRRTFKKRPIEPTLLGEKSTFSITPFLNRSKGLAEENEDDDDDQVEDSILGPRSERSATKVVEVTTTIPIRAADESASSEPTEPVASDTEKPKPQVKTRGRPKKILVDAPSAKKNAQPLSVVKKTGKAKSSSKLRQVTEVAEPELPAGETKAAEEPAKKPTKEPSSEPTGESSHGPAQESDKQSDRESSKEPAKAPTRELKKKTSKETTKETKTSSQESSTEPTEKTTAVKFNYTLPQEESNTSAQANAEQPKKKKRKVLGSTKTLFDEEEGEAPPQVVRKPSKAQLGAKRTTAAKQPLSTVKRNAFAGGATFSPLKRDRRGVGASFLA